MHGTTNIKLILGFLLRLKATDFHSIIFLFSRFTVILQGDQKVSVHVMITIESSGAQRLFDRAVYTGWCKIVYLLWYFVQLGAKLCIYCDTAYRVAQNFIFTRIVVLTRKYQPYSGWRVGSLIPYTVGIRICSSTLCGTVRRSLKGGARNDCQFKLFTFMAVLTLLCGNETCRRRRTPSWNSWDLLKVGWKENWHCGMIGSFRLK